MRATAIATAALVTAVAAASGASAATKERGVFTTLPTGTSMRLSLEGIAQIKRTADSTTVKVHVRGLEPGTTYAAHLHNAACSVNEGGAHYKNDPAGPSMPPNELWLSSTDDPMAGIAANAGGVARGFGSADWVARDEADSVVVHAIPPGGSTAGGPKIACADLG
jgi:Cu/Zn superoxide dismutase